MRLDRLAALLAAVLGLLVAVRLGVAHANAGWEFAQLVGLAAALVGLGMLALPVRPRQAPSAAPLSLRAHEWLGWAVAALTALHVGATLAADGRSLEYLRPTMPMYQWAGIGATLALLVLTVASTGAVRRRLWTDHRNFQALHAAVACAFVALATAHVVGTGRYTRGPLRIAVYGALAIVGLLVLVRARRLTPLSPPPPRYTRAMVFGRHSPVLLGIALITAVATAGLCIPRTAGELREPALRRAHGLATQFPHDKHRDVNCIQCHHNYTDRTGLDTCFACHRSVRPDLRRGIEARMHDFCLDCHREPDPRFEHHGPVAGCESCHPPSSGAGRIR